MPADTPGREMSPSPSADIVSATETGEVGVLSDARSFVVSSHRGQYVVRRESLAAAMPEGLRPEDRLIVDETVWATHAAVSTLALGEQTCRVAASESLKSIDGVTPILSWLLDSGFKRNGMLYAVGGGTVQDAVCFIASILHRGARWTFVPTTLLAQGDSCIGSKSSINHAGYKNQIGTFYPPSEVIIDAGFLETLSPGEVRSGLGEMVHYAGLDDEQTFMAYEAALAPGWQLLGVDELAELAMRTLAVKRRFVEEDEFDEGPRKVLNFGHTFGHGLEYASRGTISHGVAVAYGVDLAVSYAHAHASLDGAVMRRFADVVRRLVDGRELGTITADDLLEGMSRDKKGLAGGVELVLLEGIGQPVCVPVPLDAEFQRFLERHLAEWGAGHRRQGSSSVGRNA